MRINWYGNYSQGGGYSGSSENMCVALEKLGVDVRVVGLKTDNKHLRENTTREGLKIKDKPFMLADIGILYGFPSAFPYIKNKIKVGFTMFETNKFPTTKGANPWSGDTGNCVDQCNKMDMILVPCEHNKKLMIESGVTVPVEKVLLGFDPDKYPLIERPKRDTFTFLILGTLTIRKNVGWVVGAFVDLFKDREDVRLIVKSNSGTVAHFSHPYKNIEFIDEFSSNEQILEYYKQADCFVFPSRGEGFGLPVIEAMATGLPCIFSNHTGLAEFANTRYNYPINKYEMTKTMKYPPKWGDVGDWYNPDYEELKTLMKYVEQNREEAYNKGISSSKWVREKFTYENTAKQLIEIFKTLIDK